MLPTTSGASSLLSLLLFTLRAYHQDKQTELKAAARTEAAEKHIKVLNDSIQSYKADLERRLREEA